MNFFLGSGAPRIGGLETIAESTPDTALGTESGVLGPFDSVLAEAVSEFPSPVTDIASTPEADSIKSDSTKEGGLPPPTSKLRSKRREIVAVEAEQSLAMQAQWLAPPPGLQPSASTLLPEFLSVEPGAAEVVDATVLGNNFEDHSLMSGTSRSGGIPTLPPQPTGQLHSATVGAGDHGSVAAVSLPLHSPPSIREEISRAVHQALAPTRDALGLELSRTIEDLPKLVIPEFDSSLLPSRVGNVWPTFHNGNELSRVTVTVDRPLNPPPTKSFEEGAVTRAMNTADEPANLHSLQAGNSRIAFQSADDSFDPVAMVVPTELGNSGKVGPADTQLTTLQSTRRADDLSLVDSVGVESFVPKVDDSSTPIPPVVSLEEKLLRSDGTGSISLVSERSVSGEPQPNRLRVVGQRSFVPVPGLSSLDQVMPTSVLSSAEAVRVVNPSWREMRSEAVEPKTLTLTGLNPVAIQPMQLDGMRLSEPLLKPGSAQRSQIVPNTVDTSAEAVRVLKVEAKSLPREPVETQAVVSPEVSSVELEPVGATAEPRVEGTAKVTLVEPRKDNTKNEVASVAAPVAGRATVSTEKFLPRESVETRAVVSPEVSGVESEPVGATAELHVEKTAKVTMVEPRKDNTKNEVASVAAPVAGRATVATEKSLPRESVETRALVSPEVSSVELEPLGATAELHVEKTAKVTLVEPRKDNTKNEVASVAAPVAGRATVATEKSLPRESVETQAVVSPEVSGVESEPVGATAEPHDEKTAKVPLVEPRKDNTKNEVASVAAPVAGRATVSTEKSLPRESVETWAVVSPEVLGVESEPVGATAEPHVEKTVKVPLVEPRKDNTKNEVASVATPVAGRATVTTEKSLPRESVETQSVVSPKVSGVEVEPVDATAKPHVEKTAKVPLVEPRKDNTKNEVASVAAPVAGRATVTTEKSLPRESVETQSVVSPEVSGVELAPVVATAEPHVEGTAKVPLVEPRKDNTKNEVASVAAPVAGRATVTTEKSLPRESVETQSVVSPEVSGVELAPVGATAEPHDEGTAKVTLVEPRKDNTKNEVASVAAPVAGRATVSTEKSLPREPVETQSVVSPEVSGVEVDLVGATAEPHDEGTAKVTLVEPRKDNTKNEVASVAAPVAGRATFTTEKSLPREPVETQSVASQKESGVELEPVGATAEPHVEATTKVPLTEPKEGEEKTEASSAAVRVADPVSKEAGKAIPREQNETQGVRGNESATSGNQCEAKTGATLNANGQESSGPANTSAPAAPLLTPSVREVLATTVTTGLVQTAGAMTSNGEKTETTSKKLSLKKEEVRVVERSSEVTHGLGNEETPAQQAESRWSVNESSQRVVLKAEPETSEQTGRLIDTMTGGEATMARGDEVAKASKQEAVLDRHAKPGTEGGVRVKPEEIAQLNATDTAKVSRREGKLKSELVQPLAKRHGTLGAKEESVANLVQPQSSEAGSKSRESDLESLVGDLKVGEGSLFASRDSAVPVMDEVGTAVELPPEVRKVRDGLLEGILSHATVLHTKDRESMDVRIRPDSNTEILVQLTMVDGRVHGHVQCERGDHTVLGALWTDLQQNLSKHGVAISGFTPTETSLSLGSSMDREGQKPQKFEWIREPAESQVGNRPAVGKSTQAWRSGRSSHLLESWA